MALRTEAVNCTSATDIIPRRVVTRMPVDRDLPIAAIRAPQTAVASALDDGILKVYANRRAVAETGLA